MANRAARWKKIGVFTFIGSDSCCVRRVLHILWTGKKPNDKVWTMLNEQLNEARKLQYFGHVK